jgi:hypothetical protein
MAVEKLSLLHLLEQIKLHVVLCVGKRVEHVLAVAYIKCNDGWYIHGYGVVMVFPHDISRCGSMLLFERIQKSHSLVSLQSACRLQ